MLVSSIGHLCPEVKNSNRVDVQNNKMVISNSARFGHVDSNSQQKVDSQVGNVVSKVKDTFSPQLEIAKRALDMII